MVGRARPGRAAHGDVSRVLESEFARLVGSGALYAVLVAHRRGVRSPGAPSRGGAPPFVQFHWREECAPVGVDGPGVQVEVIGDRYLGRPHPPEVRRRLAAAGFIEPGVLGDDFDNWVAFRTGEGSEPRSVGRMLVAGLAAMEVPLVTPDEARRRGVVPMEFEWIRADETFDVHAVLRAMVDRRGRW